MKLRFSVLVTALLLLAQSASGQFVAVGTANVPASADDLESWAIFATVQQKSAWLRLIGVDPPLVENFSQSGHLASMQLKPLPSAKGSSRGVLFLPQGIGATSALYLLEQSASGAWRILDQQLPSCWDGACALELLTGPDLPAPQLLLHHVNRGHGTGELIDELQVFSVLSGKLRLTLTTTDLSEVEEMGSDRQTRQISTFLLLPGTILEETRVTSLNDHLRRAERRLWRWSAAQHRWLAGSFQPVLSRP